MMFATGLTLVKLFVGDKLFAVGVVVMILSAFVALLGFVKYLLLRKELSQIYERRERVKAIKLRKSKKYT